MNILKVENLGFSYNQNNKQFEILKDVNVEFEKGKLYAIVGESGSGKTTALSLLGALDNPNSGSIIYKEQDIKKIGYTKYRRDNVALVFQNYNLIKYMNAIENVVTAMDIKKDKIDKNKKAIETLAKLGIDEEDMKRSVLQLSGGQQQRVAIARALVKDTDMILADEPTGNLDEQTTSEILDIFISLAHKYDKCVIIVTHSNYVSSKADVVYKVSNKSISKIS
jgi:putative ABC transport system ATP-binding protein